MTDNYQGMSYEQASREAARLMQRSVVTGSWFELPEQLMELRTIMQTHQGAFADLNARRTSSAHVSTKFSSSPEFPLDQKKEVLLHNCDFWTEVIDSNMRPDIFSHSEDGMIWEILRQDWESVKEVLQASVLKS